MFNLSLLSHDKVVDLFAGGGGASTGIEKAIGRPIDIAVNHDPKAIAMHRINHPHTKHYIEDIWEVNPLEVTNNEPVGLLWLSPDCRHHSRCTGGKVLTKQVRSLAWVGVKWAKLTKPRVIALESVSQFEDWGPLLINGKPCKDSKGQTFKRFVKSLTDLGYKVEYRNLKACDYGAPTIRERLFLIAR